MEMEKLLELLGMVLIAAAIIFFLLPQRAWGETSLMNLFKGQDANSNDGDLVLGHKALDVKVDVEDSSNPNVYEFHMTDQGVYGNKHMILVGLFNEKIYFALRNWNADKCTLFTTRKIPGGIRDIQEVFNYVYYVDPGTIIDSSCNSLDKCLTNKISSSGCKNICPGFEETSQQPSDFSVCGQCWGEGLAKEDKALTQPFSKGTDYCNDNTAGCPSEANGGCCPLVGDTPSTKYTPQYGLICGYEQVSASTIDSNAKWFACTDDPGSKGRKVFADKGGNFQTECKNREWILTADQGLNLEDAQVKYSGLADYDTAVKFNIVNYNKNPLTNAAVTVTVKDKDADIDCDVDAKSLTRNYFDSDYSYLENIQSLAKPKFNTEIWSDGQNLCWKAKTFNVELKYKYSGSDKTNNFKITCNPPNTDANGVWHNECTVEKT